MNIDIQEEPTSADVVVVRPNEPEVQDKSPTIHFIQAGKNVECRTLCMASIHSIGYLLLLGGQLGSLANHCKYGQIERWSVLFTVISFCHLYHHLYQVYVLRHPGKMQAMAEELNQTKHQEQPPAADTDEATIVDQLETQIRQNIFSKNRSLLAALVSCILLSQASLIMFLVIIEMDEYRMRIDPLPHYEGNCQDFLLNIGLAMFIMQFVTYFAFYISCLVFLSFFPFLLVFLVGYLATYIVRRIRGHMTSRRFPVKLAEEIHNDRECAICMQEYQPQEQIKELTCDARHHFHKECIDQWLKVQSVCPLCRKNFLQ